MEKSDEERTYCVLGRLLRRLPLPPSVGLYHAARSTTTTPSSRQQANRHSFGAGHFTEGQKFHKKQAQKRRSPKILLGCTEVPWQKFLGEDYMGQPMKQEVPDTCAVVACVVWLQAVHWIEHVKLHGDGGLRFEFPWRCMAAALRRLFVKCDTDGIWMPGKGADVGKVLNKIQETGGLPAINVPTLAERVLPLRSWEMHWWGHSHGRGLSPERVAELLRKNGPCIGVLWVIEPWYQPIDADDAAGGVEQVYYTGGCGRCHEIRLRSEDLFDGQVGWHAVVCFGYRFRDGHMHVLVLDNHKSTGPRRWIHVKEFHTLYTLPD